MFERYYQELLNFISRSLADRDAAADVVQETFARVLALQPATGGESVREPRALLYRTARNIVIDQHRRAQVRDHDDLDSMELAAPAAQEPEARYATRQRTEALLGVIEALPPRCREAFILHKFDGLSHAEIAERMGISRNMVEKHVINAMLVCRRSLAGQDAEPASAIGRMC
ncbi:sigma-70 family RNA polymerase sigma factor [Chitiniphilus eburneus]|uniref:Sigma-70 family RNA polymerase sigma factor n=1 Tax=Chitiniphilus eburneus TaxID=2571148 RepID=A0A4U0PX42_9NEIS|nr:sigma-70 family RNA polymerase sigma factor [Chitiniphilus eburneus]TJZ73143.1 sigma-70 family RNA polymerase sigma factor [Chitiniphilus eburneus]